MMLIAHSSAGFPAAPGASAGGTWDFALVTAEGQARVSLRPEASMASAFVRAVLAQQQEVGELAGGAHAAQLEPPPGQPPRAGLRFYRAEPVPAHWASPEWPATV